MPGFDGTGPKGKGALTGHGLGRCFSRLSSSRKMKFMSLAVPVAAAVLNDIRKPDGIARTVLANFKSTFFAKSREEIPEPQNKKTVKKEIK